MSTLPLRHQQSTQERHRDAPVTSFSHETIAALESLGRVLRPIHARMKAAEAAARCGNADQILFHEQTGKTGSGYPR
ncbi:hypothetical protein [Roseitalea porphyridii]|uniref:hypothetical protein n=1 Tax=Roseitalea porphyridii TaxID=1852022 RepID=UPI0032EBA67F